MLIIVLERRAGDLLDDHAENARAGAVVPFFAWIAQQRQLPLVLFRRLSKPILDRVRKRIADARGVRQQVSDGHGPLGRPRFVSCILLIEFRNDLQVVKPGQVFRHRIIEAEFALFEQHHDGHRGHRLGHRRDRKDGIHGHGDIVGDSELARCAFVQYVIAADNEGDDAGRVAPSDGVT